MKKYEITQEKAQTLLDYLVLQPFREVAVHVTTLQTLPLIKEEKGKNEKPRKKD